MSAAAEYQEMRKATLVGAGVNFFLAVLKLVMGYLGKSQALLADGVHSFSDLLTDVLVLCGVKYGRRAADADHPYGHGRIETAATFGLAVLIACAGFGIIYNAIHHLIWVKAYVRPSWFVIAVAFISVVINEGLYRYTLSIAKETHSVLLKANAWHSRSDAWSSLVVLVGVISSFLGWYYLDQCAAVIVGLLIIQLSWHLSWSSLRELVDTGLDEATVAQLRKTICDVSGVASLHQLRTRSMGAKVFLDVHILVAPYITVSEGHYIGEQVELCVRLQHHEIADVTVHVDPEDDETVAPSRDLPNRLTLEPQLRAQLRGLPGAENLKNIVLHYLAGKIEVELWLDKEILLQSDNPADVLQWQQQYQIALRNIAAIRRVKLLFN